MDIAPHAAPVMEAGLNYCYENGWGKFMEGPCHNLNHRIGTHIVVRTITSKDFPHTHPVREDHGSLNCMPSVVDVKPRCRPGSQKPKHEGTRFRV